MTRFADKMKAGINNEMERQDTNVSLQASNAVQDSEHIQQLVNKCNELTVDIKVKVPTLKNSNITIDQKNLHQEMERSMIVHSHIIHDVYQMKCLVQKMKVLLNSLVGTLHHSLKFKNQLRVKSAKEMETYIAQEASYNIININIQNVNNIIERSSELSNMMKQKIGFIRDLTKMKTQEMYSAE